MSESDQPGETRPMHNDSDDTEGHLSRPIHNDDEDDTEGHLSRPVHSDGEVYGFSGSIKPDPNVIS